jgi:lipopolysaccharide export system permease protein
MKILDRYLVKNFLMSLAYCMFLFMFLYVVVDIFGSLDEILRNKVPVLILLEYYASFFPVIFVQTLPISSLLAVVYVFSTLNKNNELTAAKSCGVSVNQMLVPVFVLSAILGLLNFIVNETYVPKGMITADRIKTNYIKTEYKQSKKAQVVENLTFYGKNNQLIYAKEFNPNEKILKGVIIIERDKQHKLKRKILAEKTVWKDGKWVFYDCLIYRFDSSGKTTGNPLVFDEKILSLEESPSQIQKYEFQTEYMSFRELKGHIERLSGSNPKVIRSMQTDLYFKTALPFVSIIIMMLGIPFALSTKRGNAMSGIGISIAIGLLYYGSIYFVLAMGKGGLLPPFVAAHLSNALFAFIALAIGIKS